MAKLRAKGHEIETIDTAGSINRRAVQFQNQIISSLKKLGIKAHQIDVPLERLAGKKAIASATWFGFGHRMHYSCNLQGKFVDNLQVVSKVIGAEANLVISEERTMDEFIGEFCEDEDVDESRRDAREFLGIEHDSSDIELINKRYKTMAKELHPDTPTGSTEKFKKLNAAHKILKRELR